MSKEFLKWKHRIQNRLLLSYFILILLIAAFLGAMAYRVSEKVIENDLTRSRQAVLQQTSKSITNILDEISSMCYLYSSDNDLMTIMRTPPEEDRFASYRQETEIMQILSRYQNTFGANDIPHYVLLYAYNGNRYSSWITNRYNFGSIPERPWFPSIVRNNGKITWISTFNDKPGYGEDISVFSAAVEVKHYLTNQPLGIIMLNIYEDALYANYKDAILERSQLYIVDANGHIVSHPDKSQLGRDLSDETYMRAILQNNPPGSGNLIASHNAAPMFISYAPIPKTGWTLVEEIPMTVVLEPLLRTRNLIVIILAVCLLAGLLFAYLIARNISRPIKLLASDMRKVKNGDFTVVSSIRSRNEIGELSHIFNRMIGNIQGLMEGVRREERLKRKAEMNVLQAQIGPHFLYNTLNSIRCMMGFGQVETAQSMTVAFMRLIRRLFENQQEWITVRQEIEHIQDYIAIMRLRYDNSFDVNFVLQEEALDGRMIKLILQPLVENAIFHGVEPKRGGMIRIEAWKEQCDLLLSVTDDGIGMTEEQLKNIWSPGRRSSGHGFNNIGIMNIQERIRLHFGKEYGLGFTARRGEGTRVTVRMPYMEKGEWTDADRLDRG